MDFVFSSLRPTLKRSRGGWVLILALVLAAAAPAQDSKPGDCSVNSDRDDPDCPVPEQPESPETAARARAAALDWVPQRQVPEELRDLDCRICDGRYIDPLAEVDRSIPPEESDVEATAQSSELQGPILHLTGGVLVRQGYRELRGDSATIDRENQSAVLEGDISLREPGLLLRGERAELYSETDEANVQGSQFVLHEQRLRGEALRFERDSQGILHIHGGALTFCAPEKEHWLLRVEEMELNTAEGLGIARGAKFNVGGVPIFYAPWLRFPLDDRRKTGLLWPDVGSDTRGGLDIAVPVYLNLAPNYDALYAPRYIQERGLNHELELRYLNPTLGYWMMGGAFMADDDRYQQEVPEARSHDRWLGTVQHQALFDKRWRSRVDYSKASDVDYLKDLDSSSLNTKRQTNLLQLGSLDYLGDRWLVNMDLQQFQSLADDISNPYKKLPQITAQYRGDLSPFSVEPIAVAQYSYFDTDDDRVIGQRVYAEAGLTYPMMWSYGFLTPKVKYRHLQYDLSGGVEARDDDQPSAGVAVVNLDGGLYFERPTRIAGRGLLQTLEPRLFYLYSDYEDQRDHPDFDSAELTFNYNQLFRETRFSGRDRLDDADQLSIGVTTRFIGEEDGREQFSASLGQILYFRDRRVRLDPTQPPLTSSGSELAAELRWYPTSRLNLRTSIVWDPYSGNTNSGNFDAGYIRGDGSIYNIGYTYRRPVSLVGTQPVTEQLNLSAFVPVRENWNLFASWNYSLEANTSVEDMIGVEYDSCCWKIRLLHLRYFDTVPGGTNDFDNPELQREHSTQVQIILKGLGGFGARVEGLLEDMIRGYKEREY